MLCEYAHAELAQPEDQGRVVVSNRDWIALVPWWATWPFETLREFLSFNRRSNNKWPQVLPYRRHIDSISQLNQDEKTSFADILGRITRRYDNLFSCSFAYSMGIHQRPVPGRDVDGPDHENNFAHLHVHFEPPLLRSSSVRKFLVGSVIYFNLFSSNIFVDRSRYELMAEAQRDITPEQAAAQLRQCSDDHYVSVQI
jgi:UDPglucose--hexose-1-phosphate uridylyltransferase